MIELPEAVTISKQMNHVLRDKRINQVERGNSPHKFAFYSGGQDYYEKLLRCVMDRCSVGKPCPSCGTIIEKTSFQGGTCYFCPECQRDL
jgi:formamidopyrimidine-DNA glycosylase